MITRRSVVLALGAGAVAAPLALFAQQPTAKVWRVGYLTSGSAAALQKTHIAEGLRDGLREFGYVEGKTLVIEYRMAEGKAERLPDMAAELVRLNVDLIVAVGTTAAIAAGRATSTIPIVVPAGGDLVAVGLAASLAKPGRNVTGQIFFAEAIGAKGLELLKEVAPALIGAGVLLPPDDPEAKLILEAITATAKHLKVRITQVTVQGEADFEGVFAAMIKQGVGAVLIPNNPLLNFKAKTMVDLALRHRLPSCGNTAFAEAGGLLGYGVGFREMFRRAAVYVDKIFKGARPGDLPIEQATQFELVVNMKTAKALGIKIPNSILVRATKVLG